MFGWLTRNDGKRGAKAARRISSQRGSVFSEFALIMPIVLLVCSALVEIVGYWDAGIMANHAAWQVGRIAMVRGTNGMAFSNMAKTETGVPNREMSSDLSAALGQIYSRKSAIADRGKIVTMFLMSTCGIGYFGNTPKNSQPGRFGALINKGFKAFADSLKEYNNVGVKSLVVDAVDTVKVEITNIIANLVDNILIKLASNIIAEVGGELVKLILEPVAGIVADKVFEALVNVQSIAVAAAPVSEELGNLSPRLARQLYGAALRLDEKPDAVRVMSMAVKPYIFTDDRRLAYPLVADSGVTSDGYFVTGAHGWPPQGEVHKLICVEVNWPYEAGWLFPAVSGYGSSKAPSVKGTSMVFTQPYIMPRYLYSQGAAAFDGPKYDASEGAFEELQKEMETYLKCARFCMQFRICEERITRDWAGSAYYWYGSHLRFCPELADVFGLRYPDTWWRHEYFWYIDYDDYDVPCYEGDYYLSWQQLTHGAEQRGSGYEYRYYDDDYSFEDCFKSENFHNNDYFHWDGSYHKSYQLTLCKSIGKVKFAWAYDSDSFAPFCYRGDGTGVRTAANDANNFSWLYDAFSPKISTNIAAVATKDWLRQKICEFTVRNKLNIPNLCAWQTPSAYGQWKAEDAAIETEAAEASELFPLIVSLVEDEIAEITKRLEQKKDNDDPYGNIDDFLIGDDDLEALSNPGAAAEKARDKWELAKAKNRACLAELEEIVYDLRRLYAGYTEKNGDDEIKYLGLNETIKAFQEDRRQATYWNFTTACMKILCASQDLAIFDEGHEATFFAYFRSNPKDPAGEPLGYPVAGRTSDILARIREYKRLLKAAYAKEAEYGKLLGLKSAAKRGKDGVPLADLVDPMDVMEGITPSGFGDGDDDDPILNYDKQKYESKRGWTWSN